MNIILQVLIWDDYLIPKIPERLQQIQKTTLYLIYDMIYAGFIGNTLQ